MMGRSEGAFPVKAVGGVFFSIDALDFVRFDGFVVGEGGEDVREAFDEHGFSGSGRAYE